MTNIWTESFKEFREPFFDIEDPYTLVEGKKETEEDDAGEDQEHKYKKSGKKSKDYDGDGEVEDESDEYAGVKDRAIKKAMKIKEELNLKSRTRDQEKLDVRQGISNKIDVNPKLKEEVDPKGDAETIQSDSAKKRTAQMQIRKELADVQLAKAKSQSGQTTNESVILYLMTRHNIAG